MFTSALQKIRQKQYAAAMCMAALMLVVSLAVHAQFQAQAAAQSPFAILNASVKATHIQDDIREGAGNAVDIFYQSRAFEPVLLSQKFQTFVPALLEEIVQSWQHGLNPDRYHTKTLKALARSQDAEDAARFERLLMQALVDYGRDLSGIRIEPQSIGQQSEYWQKPEAPEDIIGGIVNAKNPVMYLRGLAPRDPLYLALQEELIALLASRPADKKEPIRLERTYLMVGDEDQSVPQLRERLQVFYDPDLHQGRYVYDDDLAAAVMDFQKENKLKGDGIIGPRTLAVLNRSHEDRIQQVLTNLERLRWLPRDLPERYLLVNIPAQKLWGVKDGQAAFEMDVIVGRTARQTNSFVSEVRGVRLNPTWTIPPGIKVKDKLPKLIEDPYALTDKGIDFYIGHGRDAERIDPGSVDWENISTRELHQIRMVQVPGDHNALGRYRILMPNNYNIYLHDTNTPELFAEEDRMLSSGCVRMSDPEKVAAFVLEEKGGWTGADTQEALGSGKMTDIMIDHPFPVYLIYLTMWRASDGTLVYGDDAYKQNQKLANALSKADHLPDYERILPTTSYALAEGDIPPG